MNKTQPNILWIGLDQIRYDTLGANGNQVCLTPQMDRLAAEGVSFSRAYTPCSLCSPARASMFTGRYAFNHGMGTNCDMYHSLSSELNHPEQLLHTMFADAGYSIGYTGKWHIGTEKGPGDYGFEGMNLPGYGNITASNEYQKYLVGNGLSYSIDSQIYANPGAQTLLGGRWKGPVESTPAHYLADRTIDLIDEFASRSMPFFLTCQFWGPHGPHLPSEEFYGLHDPERITPWENWEDDLEGKPSRIERESNSFYRNHPRNWKDCRELVGLYYDATAMVDYQIGRLLEHLEEQELNENTVIVLSSDHGDMTGSHGGQLDKGMLYEEAQHVPLIFYLPGEEGGRICDDLSMNMDILPTLMDLAGISIPEDLDAISLKPALLDETDRAKRECVYLEFHGLRFLYSQRAIVTNDGWKYIFTPGDNDEVYNLNDDPYELNNIILTVQTNSTSQNNEILEKIEALRDMIRTVSALAGDPLRDCISKFFGIWNTDSNQVDATKFFN